MIQKSQHRLSNVWYPQPGLHCWFEIHIEYLIRLYHQLVINNLKYHSLSHKITRGVLMGSVLLILLVCCAVMLCVFTFWVPCCFVPYVFHIQNIFGWSLPPVVWRRSSCLIYIICVCSPIVMCNTYCIVLLFCLSSCCVPYVTSFSGLSIFDCPVSIIQRLLCTS